MPARIADLVKGPVYGGDYRSPEQDTESLPTPVFRHPWMIIDTSKHQKSNKQFREKLEGTAFINIGEADQVVETIRHFCSHSRQAGQRVPTTMVITFYLGQAHLIRRRVKQLPQELVPSDLHILPIDRCQGQEADLVIISFSRTKRKPRPGTGLWLQDPRRLNVAFTRAKKSLVLVGCASTLVALRGEPNGERILAHLGEALDSEPSHRIYTIEKRGEGQPCGD